MPPDALREAILNAVMHRDYTRASGYVAIAVFDDHIEIQSIGSLPRGITPESLVGSHRSVRRNPLIADAFHRTGAVEIWGRGTNRVIEECERYGIAPPTFEEWGSGAVRVTFRAEIVPGPTGGPSRDQVGTKLGLSDIQAQVLESARTAQPLHALMEASGRSNRTKFRDQVVRPLLDAGLLVLTIPDKPTSSKQTYQTTKTGSAFLQRQVSN